MPPVEGSLAEILSQPIEDWMVFLHPDQHKLIDRAYSGPARVRGAAGTGKTVVGLHRAAHLARSYDGPILFTTYIRTLPPVLEQLFVRLAPDVAERVEFRNIHSWAFSYLRSIGRRLRIDSRTSGSGLQRGLVPMRPRRISPSPKRAAQGLLPRRDRMDHSRPRVPTGF